MKFLCDQCKAKYQIADEKVAGRTVRMKCRKCGHMIEVRAEVTESSVSRSLPTQDDPSSAPKPGGLATSFSAARPARGSQAPSALAGAFSRKVQNDEDETVMGPPAAFEASVTEEWYAAINGVPVGPMRLSELRTKASAGAINDDTLAWQEGFEEWRPVKTITQLAAIVREAASPKPLTGAPAPATPAPPRVAAKPSPAARQTAPIGPAPARDAVAPRSNVVSISRSGAAAAAAVSPLAPASSPAFSPAAALAPASAPALAPAASLAPLAAPQSNPFAGVDPFAPAPAPSPFAPAPMAQAAPVPMAVADPFASVSAAAPAFAPPAPAPMAEPFEVPPQQQQQQQKKGVPLLFVAVLVLAAAFGITAAVLTFKSGDKPVATAPSAAVPAPPAPPTADPNVPPPAPTDSVAVTAEADAGPQKVAMGGARGPAGPAVPAPATSKSSTAVNLADLGLGGPGTSKGPTSAAGAGPTAGSGQALDAASIQRTIGTYKAAVKRKCWDNASENKPSANVSISVTVASTGLVSSASGSGDDPVVARCVENHVRGWKFEGGGQTVIPFHFVRQ